MDGLSALPWTVSRLDVIEDDKAAAVRLESV